MGCGSSIHKPDRCRPWELRIEIEWRATEGAEAGRVYTPEFSGYSSSFSINLDASSLTPQTRGAPQKRGEVPVMSSPLRTTPPIYPKQWLPKNSSPDSTPQMRGPLSPITGTLVFIVPQEIKDSVVFRCGRGFSPLLLPTAGIPAGSEEFVSECNGTYYCSVKRVELVNPNLEGKEKVVEERVEVPGRVPTSTQAPAQQTPYGPPADTNDSLFRV